MDGVQELIDGWVSQQQQHSLIQVQNNHDAWEEVQQSTLKTLQTLQDTVQAQAQQQDWLWERWQGVLWDRDEDAPQLINARTGTTDILDTLRNIHSELLVLRRQEKCEERLATTLDKLDQLLKTLSVENQSHGQDNIPDASATTTNAKQPPPKPQNSVTRNHHDHQPLALAVWALIRDNETPATRAGAQLLYLYCVNVSSHPRVPRYRKIFSSNESYQKNVATLTGAPALLEAVGFVPMNNNNSNQNETTITTAPDYWEWLPPSIHPKGDEGGNDTTNPCVAASPKQAWLGDSEEFYLQRLKMAAAALSLIKSPTFRPDNDQSELLELFGVDGSALGEPSSVPVSNHSSFSAGGQEERSVSTPDRSGISFPDDMPAEMNFTPTMTKGYDHHSNSGGHVFETPETGSVLSPPTTKKQLSLNSDFPSMVEDNPLGLRQHEEVILTQPTLNVLREGVNTTYESSEGSFGGAATDSGTAEAALWK